MWTAEVPPLMWPLLAIVVLPAIEVGFWYGVKCWIDR
jgi:hypothetical protein